MVINKREADKWRNLTQYVYHHDLSTKCFTPCFTVTLLILLFSTSLSACLTQPCYISLPRLPLNGKQLVWGLPRAHFAQFFNEFSSTSPLSSFIQCAPLLPVLIWGGAVQLKQKKNSLYENMFLTHIWYSLPLCVSANLFPNPTPWWYSGVMAGSTFDKMKNAEIYCSWALWTRMHVLK